MQGFQELKSRLEITDLQSTTVSIRQQEVRNAVARRLTIKEDFLTGSYKRNTLIAPLSEADIDIFEVLDASYFRQDGQVYILDKVRDVLLETYTRTPKISRDGQAITITFNDFKVDVVPAFYRQGGGYLIPNSISKQWISTDPKQHISIWSTENSKHRNDLIPLIKMLKCWKREANVEVSSFFFECLILKILTNVNITSFSSGVSFVFNKARSAIKFPVSDPAGYNSNVGQYISQYNLNDAVSKLETAYSRAINAEQAEARGNIQEAIRIWKVIFGDYFPVFY